MKQKRQLIKQVETYNNELQYDIQAKKLFGTKSVFARIIQLCVPEFLGMDIEEVKSHILDVEVLSKEVSEGYGDGRFVRNEEERILLLSSESKVEGEKEDKISYMRLKDQENNIVPEADLIHLILIRLSEKEYKGEEV